MKIKLQPVYERLNKDRLIKLLQYILKVQGAELKRLDFTAAAKELNISRAQLARDCQTLERAQLIKVVNGEMQLSPDIISETTSSQTDKL